MRLQSKINLFMLMTLGVLAGSIVLTGYLTINRIIYQLYEEQFNRELFNINARISHAYETLESAGVLALKSYVVSRQRKVLDNLKDYQYDDTGHLYIIDQNNKVLLHPFEANDSRFTPTFVQTMLQQRQGKITYTYRGKPYFATFITSSDWQWLIVLAITEEEIFTNRSHYLHKVSFISGGILGLILFIALYLTRHSSNKINLTLDYLQRMGDGNVKTRVPTQGKDEIAVIQTAINQMMDKIETEINQRKQTEKDLALARDAAESANRAKSVFLANVSHELRTPLNGILGYTQILKLDKSLDAQHQREVQIIHQSGTYLLTLINDILDLSRMEADQMTLYPDNFYFAHMVNGVVDLFRLQAIQKQLQFNYYTLNPLPEIVYGDEKRLRQILINLLSNAIKFTDSGYVSLSIQIQQEQFIFKIEDSGIGIDTNELQRIFRPFKQTGDRQKKSEGTGLGLAISQRLVELMGGQLKVESVLGKGSHFWFNLHLPITQHALPQEDTLLVESEPNAITPPTHETTSTPAETAATDVNFNPEDAQIIYDMAMMGDVQAIIDHCQCLQRQDNDLNPLLEQLIDLADQMKSKKIRQLMQTFLA